MPLLETIALSKRFGGLHAITNLDLAVELESIHGLIGPNGSGKSTLFTLVTGVYSPDRGSRVVFEGVDITDMASYRAGELGIARTFQLLRLFQELTVLQNVMVGYHRHIPYGFFATISDSARVQTKDAEIRAEMME